MNIEKLKFKRDKLDEEIQTKEKRNRISRFMHKFKKFVKEPPKLHPRSKRCEAYFDCCWAGGRCDLKEYHDGPHTQSSWSRRVWYISHEKDYVYSDELKR